MVIRSRGTGPAASGGRVRSAPDSPTDAGYLVMEPAFNEGRFFRFPGENGIEEMRVARCTAATNPVNHGDRRASEARKEQR